MEDDILTMYLPSGMPIKVSKQRYRIARACDGHVICEDGTKVRAVNLRVTLPDIDPQAASDDVKTALDIIAAIKKAYTDEVSEKAKDKGASFFEGVLKGSRAIAATVNRTHRATPAQIQALNNMYEGVRKWIHED